MAGQKKAVPLIDRILSKCTPLDSGCLEWAGYSPGGYGRIRWKGARVAVHRAVYEMNFGPLGDLCVCHKCDNPKCVNPDHLFAGTRADNNADKTIKGRQAKGPSHGVRGERSHLAKLTSKQVAEIRNLRGLPQHRIASAYGISQPQVSGILNNRSWSHI